jgi:hypothetical protein
MTTLSVVEVRNELYGIFPLLLPDSSVAVVDSNYLREQFLPWFQSWCLSAGLNYASEAKDCDKFARAFVSQAHFAAWRRQAQYAPAVGWMAVTTDNGNGHALNLVRIQTGWVEIDPQELVVRPLRSQRDSIRYAVM